MQQQLARENRRDSSALKIISLLTMVFLPFTAIAVSSAPALGSLLITSQFWAVAGWACDLAGRCPLGNVDSKERNNNSVKPQAGDQSRKTSPLTTVHNLFLAR